MRFIPLLLLCPLPASGLLPAVGHVEIAPTYQSTNQTWSWSSYWYDDDLNERTDLISTLFFPGLNRFYDTGDAGNPENLGCKWLRPPGSNWDFMGVDEDEPVWIYSDTALASAGFHANPANLTGNMHFTLTGVEGPVGGHFSMFFGSAPLVFMKTIDGIDSSDVLPKPSSHYHTSWAFSRKGLWIISLKVRGTLKSSNTPTTESAPQPLVFAIGDLAMWRASHFDIPALRDPTISGDDADPDQDGLPNLLEYFLGGHPLVASTHREEDALPLAPELIPPATNSAPWRFRYLMRDFIDDPDVSHQVESSTDLTAATWQTTTATPEVIDIGGGWRQITVSLPSGSHRFARLRVVATD